MDSLSTGRVAQTLQRLFAQAAQADHALMAEFRDIDLSDAQQAEAVAHHFAEERRDVRGFYHGYVDNYLNVTAAYGRFLYQCARSRNAKCIVEFGTSMGISTIHLAAALRDMGGGRLIGTELEPSKAARAQANLEAAGLAELVEIRVGDARETLTDVGEVDMVLLDGAFSLYLPVLKLLEPGLKVGTPILAENAIDQENEFLDYVRNPQNGYVSQPIPISDGRGNEFVVRTR
ncbi:O-methyltransferase [Chitinasiproducens palmae]|uniref:Methyltransferase domain-containing protein n=1 Tax=Chitinasiproducens palmae TaxID=1770053 RepID=A0A1H2PUA3_9BURK|nr:class I SAM-dependent methyltransferase [Chitinasiproducens palmae]SDV50756.1 Methyltransferase domain-containing protein [Chitinasiproducens palmae]